MQGIYLFPLFSESMERHYNEKIFSLIFISTKDLYLVFKVRMKLFMKNSNPQSPVPIPEKQSFLTLLNISPGIYLYVFKITSGMLLFEKLYPFPHGLPTVEDRS